MNELRALLAHIYSSPEAVERWIQARGRIESISGECRAIRAWMARGVA